MCQIIYDSHRTHEKPQAFQLNEESRTTSLFLSLLREGQIGKWGPTTASAKPEAMDLWELRQIHRLDRINIAMLSSWKACHYLERQGEKTSSSWFRIRQAVPPMVEILELGFSRLGHAVAALPILLCPRNSTRPRVPPGSNRPSIWSKLNRVNDSSLCLLAFMLLIVLSNK